MIRKIWIRSFVFLIASRNENESERMWQRDFPCDNWTVSFQRSLGYVFAYISILKVTSVARLREKKCMKERKKVREEREKERRRGRDPVKSPRGTRQRFASLYPWSKPFLFSPSRAKRLCLFLPIHSRLLVDRFSFVIPFAAAKENVPAKWERVSPIQCRTCRQRDQLWQIVCVSRDIAKTIF